MKKSIMISTKKREEHAKEVQIEECYKQRNQEITSYQQKNPFSYLEWLRAWKCGWLRQHGLGFFSFPSPIFHYRKLWRTSKESYFVTCREEAKKKHREFLRGEKKCNI